jgi:hypothetical protein
MEEKTFGSVILPSTHDADGFVELARTTRGRLFRKQILHMDSSFTHPSAKNKKITVDEAMAKSLVENFKAGHCDIVQVPIVDGKNQHTEDPLRNIGEVVDINYDKKGIYAVIDARNEEHADKLGKTLIGASALMHLDYEDTKTGKKVGPTLLHVAVTNRPYITNLDNYEQIVAASADSLGVDEPEVMSPADEAEDTPMDLAELTAKLKEEHGIDLDALQAQATAPNTDELVAAMSNVLKEAGVIAAPDETEEISVQDVAKAVIELSQERIEQAEQIVALTAANAEAKQEKAEAEVDRLVTEGRILPKQRDVMVKLSMTDRETFDTLVPETPIVSLSADGVTHHEAPGNEAFEKLEAEAQRYADLANGVKK